jgi:hypothetical protein
VVQSSLFQPSVGVEENAYNTQGLVAEADGSPVSQSVVSVVPSEVSCDVPSPVPIQT